MRASNKIFIILMSIITAAISAIFATAIDAVVNNTSLVSKEIKEDLNWFAQNPDVSNPLVWVLYGFAALLVLIALMTIISTGRDKKTTEDERFMKDVSERN